MQEKLKELELLASQLLARQKDVLAQNASLTQRLRTLEGNVDKLKKVEAELHALKEWKKNTQTVLRRLATRVEKELEKARQESKIV